MIHHDLMYLILSYTISYLIQIYFITPVISDIKDLILVVKTLKSTEKRNIGLSRQLYVSGVQVRFQMRVILLPYLYPSSSSVSYATYAVLSVDVLDLDVSGLGVTDRLLTVC